MDIKFELNQGSNHIYIPVYVNDKGPFQFCVDTGATATTLSKSLVDRLGIRTYPNETIEVSIPAMRAAVDSLKIGAEVLQTTEVLVIDFAELLRPCGGAMEGIIGFSTLKNYKMSVNYNTKVLKLEISASDESKSSNLLQWRKFEYADGTHLVTFPTFINNRGPFDFVVDTGAGGTIVTQELAEKLGLMLNQGQGQIQCVGIGGNAGGSFAVLERLSVANVTQEKAPAVVLDLKAVTRRGSSVRYGILGYPFLKDIELIIDYPAKRFAVVDLRRS
ncbi:MAG: aspartyl protease family protein [Candidatus Hodarchaeota archaeon]